MLLPQSRTKKTDPELKPLLALCILLHRLLRMEKANSDRFLNLKRGKTICIRLRNDKKHPS